MLVTPALIKVVNNSPCYMVYIMMVVFIIAEESLVVFLSHVQNHSILNEAINETVPYLLGYSVFFLLGLHTKRLNEEDERKQLAYIILLSIGFMGYWLFKNGDMVIINYKYPQLIYIIYGCIMPVLLWSLRKIFNLNVRYDMMGTAEKKLINTLVFLGAEYFVVLPLAHTICLNSQSLPFLLAS